MSNQVTLVYNHCQERLRLSLNGRPAPQYGSVTALLGKPFLQWAELILPALRRALNSDFDLRVECRPFEAMILEALAREYRSCLSVSTAPPELNISTHERMSLLEDLQRETGEKPTQHPLYLDVHLSSTLCQHSEVYYPLTGDTVMDAGETYDCMLPGAMARCGSATLSATMQRYDPAQAQAGGNVSLVLMAAGEADAQDMLRRLPITDELVVLYIIGSGPMRFLRRINNVLAFQVPANGLKAALEQTADFTLCTPLLIRQAERLRRLSRERYDMDVEHIALKLDHLSSVEPFYIVEPIPAIQAGESRPLGVRRVPASGTMPALSVRCDPPNLLFFDGQRLTASDDLDKPENVHIEIFAADRADPISRQHFTITIDEEPTTMALLCPRTSLSVGESTRLDVELAHVKKTTPRTTEWRSSATQIATVRDGVVTALSGGTVTITAIKGELQASVTLRITSRLMAIDLSNRMLRVPLLPGQVQRTPLMVYAAQGQYDSLHIRCSSANEAVARFEPARLSESERGALPPGKMILAEGYVVTRQTGRAQLEFYQDGRREAVHSFMSVTADAAAPDVPPAPRQTSWLVISVTVSIIALLLLFFLPGLSLAGSIAALAMSLYAWRCQPHGGWQDWAGVALAALALLISLIVLIL